MSVTKRDVVQAIRTCIDELNLGNEIDQALEHVHDEVFEEISQERDAALDRARDAENELVALRKTMKVTEVRYHGTTEDFIYSYKRYIWCSTYPGDEVMVDLAGHEDLEPYSVVQKEWRGTVLYIDTHIEGKEHAVIRFDAACDFVNKGEWLDVRVDLLAIKRFVNSRSRRVLTEMAEQLVDLQVNANRGLDVSDSDWGS